MPVFPRLESDVKTDVLIIGGGMAGILTAYAMEQAGIDYLLIEADTICSGVTRNTTAKITSQHGLIYSKLLKMHGKEAARLYFDANEAALEKYRQLCRDISCDFEEKDSCVYSLNNPQKLALEANALDQLGIPYFFETETSLPFHVSGSIRFKKQAQFHPLKFVSCIAQGLRILEHTKAIAFGGKTVYTDTGMITAQNIIIATHFPILNKHGSFFLKMYQQRSYVLALEGVQPLDAMYRDEADDGLSFRNHGDFLLLGGNAHRTGKKSSGWRPLEVTAQKFYPQATTKFQWATQDCMTLDHMPYIGQYSKHTPGLYVAAGFNKWGMTGSMIAAAVLTQMIGNQQAPHGNLFSPSRSMLHRQLLTNIGESAMNLLTFSKPRCPHLGCALKWNRYERSWDCPCHGSRFDAGGKLLDNPATDDLKKS